MSDRVKAIATDLGGTQLLAKLSEGDMIATEAKYHRKCLIKLYHRHRNYNKAKSDNGGEI